MRIGSVLVIIWPVIGALAAGQRGYFNSDDPDCSKLSTIAATIFAGPLNYIGVNPKISCKEVKPSQ